MKEKTYDIPKRRIHRPDAEPTDVRRDKHELGCRSISPTFSADFPRPILPTKEVEVQKAGCEEQESSYVVERIPNDVKAGVCFPGRPDCSAMDFRNGQVVCKCAGTSGRCRFSGQKHLHPRASASRSEFYSSRGPLAVTVYLSRLPWFSREHII